MQRSAAMKSVIVLVVIVVLLSLAASVNLYYVSDGAGATLFYKGDEAYLFVGTGSTGYHFSCLRYPFVILKDYFHAPPIPADEHVSGAVIRITPSVVERFQTNFGKEVWAAPDFLTPFDDGFYAMCPGVVLCKWTGDRFEPASEEDRRRLDGTNRLFHGDINNQIVNGWSVRQIRRS